MTSAPKPNGRNGVAKIAVWHVASLIALASGVAVGWGSLSTSVGRNTAEIIRLRDTVDQLRLDVAVALGAHSP